MAPTATSLLSNVFMSLLITFATCAALFLKFFVWDSIIRPRWSVRYVPGPKTTGYVRGHLPLVNYDGSGKYVSQWFKEYGRVFKFDSQFGGVRLAIDDRRALHHIFVEEAYKFPKPGILTRLLSVLVGHGLLVVEGDTHRRQRKIMNPSFGAVQIKTLFPIFIEKALQLRDTLTEALEKESPQATIDIYEHASRATLDVISSAGFGYETNSIELGNQNELAGAFNQLFSTQGTPSWRGILVRVVPAFKYIVPRRKTVHEMATERAHDTMHRIGNQLLEEKKAAAMESAADNKSSTRVVAANQMAGKDLLSVLVKANMAADLKPAQKMTDQEVMDQITTFLVAGNDTTANAISWTVYGLCKNIEAQAKLRDEILQVNEDVPSYDTINSLPYLDAVIRESLRYFAPVAGTTRVASEDSVIPLGNLIAGTDGVVRRELHVGKGTMIYIPIVHMNRNPEIWGSDAGEFNPDRFINVDKLPEGVLEMPSLAFPTFLAGPRGCIGWKFSYIEMKTIIYSLVRVLKFEPAVPLDDIEGKSNIVTRPRMKSRPEASWQLPVKISLVDA